MKNSISDSIQSRFSPDEQLKERVVQRSKMLKYGKKTMDQDTKEIQNGTIKKDKTDLPESEMGVLKNRWTIYLSTAAAVVAVIAISAVAILGVSQLRKNPSKGSSYETDESSGYEEAESPAIIEMTKEEVFLKMINSIDYFDTVEGEYILTWGDPSIGDLYAFKSDQNKGTALCSTVSVEISDPLEVLGSGILKRSCTSDVDTRFVCDGEEKVSYNAKTKAYDRNYAPPAKRRPESDTISSLDFEKDGTVSSCNRPDTTNLLEAGFYIFPLDIANNYLSNFDLWEIEGYEIILGRGCVVISGTSEGAEYGLLYNAKTFKMYIDCRTGVILKYLGFDENGELSRYTAMQSISFDATIPEITMADLETGYIDN